MAWSGWRRKSFTTTLPDFELGREPAKAGLVLVGGRAERELRAKLLGEPALEADDGLIADLVFLRQEAVGLAQFVLRQPLHSNEQAALVARAARPVFDEAINRFPAAQIEVADAEVGSL